VDVGTIAGALLVLHFAVDQGEQREVAPHPDVPARVDLGPDLSDQDVSRHDALAAEDFHSAMLAG